MYVLSTSVRNQGKIKPFLLKGVLLLWLLFLKLFLKDTKSIFLKVSEVLIVSLDLESHKKTCFICLHIFHQYVFLIPALF